MTTKAYDFPVTIVVFTRLHSIYDTDYLKNTHYLWKKTYIYISYKIM